MRQITDYPIGIFDSGLGGLTVFREIEKLLPRENLLYFGDTARVPYGTKSKHTIIRFTTQNILFLLKKKVKVVVVACNTASSLALEYVRRVFNVPLIGVIDAGVEKALSLTRTGHIGVIGTRSTIASRAYERKLIAKRKDVTVLSCPCPLFVPLAEEGITKGVLVEEAVKMYLKNIKGRADTLILGCTHYPLLKRPINAYLRDVRLVDSAKEVARKTRMLLKEHSLLSGASGKKPSREFYVTDEPAAFMKTARIFLKRQIARPKVVSL